MSKVKLLGWKQEEFLSDLSKSKLFGLSPYDKHRNLTTVDRRNIIKAINAHNNGNCAINCPLPREARVIAESTGVRGGKSYVLCSIAEYERRKQQENETAQSHKQGELS